LLPALVRLPDLRQQRLIVVPAAATRSALRAWSSRSRSARASASITGSGAREPRQACAPEAHFLRAAALPPLAPAFFFCAVVPGVGKVLKG
jgi:hypothetical protein